MKPPQNLTETIVSLYQEQRHCLRQQHVHDGEHRRERLGAMGGLSR